MIVLPPLLRDPGWCNTGLRRYGNTGGLGSLDPSQSPGLVTDETRKHHVYCVFMALPCSAGWVVHPIYGFLISANLDPRGLREVIV
jgi:hypothetical protein